MPGAKAGFKMEDAGMYAEKDTGTMGDAGGKEEARTAVDAALRCKEKTQEKQEKTPEDHHVLGRLSEKYETGGRGVGTVSIGKGDPGGVSYGLYQMTSKNHETGEIGGTVKQYVESDSFPWKKEFEGLEPGSEEFSEKWKECSEKYPEEFRKSQHAYIKGTHYMPTNAALKDKIGLDAREGSATLRDVIWSTGVQHKGPELIRAAAKRVEKTTKGMDRSSPEYERKVIEAIYDERATRCKKCPPNQKKGYDRRMVLEKKEALELFDKEHGGVKGGQE